MTETRWEIATTLDLQELCRHRRGRTKGNTYCELPVDHIVGRNHEPFFELAHTGRGPAGYWYAWEMELGSHIEDIRECRRLRETMGLPPDPPWWPKEARNVH